MASVQGSKEPRRVRAHWSEGRRDLGMGEKRESSKALYFQHVNKDDPGLGVVSVMLKAFEREKIHVRG